MKYTKLSHRGQITLNGQETADFLQSLITNDVEKLDHQKSVYACLLTPQGKFLHDFHITRQDGKFILNCEPGDRATDLYTRLKRYRLRRPIEITLDDDTPCYVIWDDTTHQYSFTQPNSTPLTPLDDWEQHRIQNTIPDGSRDMIVEKSTPLECNLDKLDGVDFKKGCYVGQELISRIHNRGLLKKRLRTIKYDNIDQLPESVDVRTHINNIAIALVRDAEIETLKSQGIEILS